MTDWNDDIDIYNFYEYVDLFNIDYSEMLLKEGYFGNTMEEIVEQIKNKATVHKIEKLWCWSQETFYSEGKWYKYFYPVK